MKTKEIIKKTLCTLALISIAASASAQHSRHRYSHKNHLTIVSPRMIPISIKVVSITSTMKATTTSKDRLTMAVAYLKENEYLKVSKYADMTGMTNSKAEAELNAFCMRSDSPLRKVIVNSKIRYIIA